MQEDFIEEKENMFLIGNPGANSAIPKSSTIEVLKRIINNDEPDNDGSIDSKKLFYKSGEMYIWVKPIPEDIHSPEKGLKDVKTKISYYNNDSSIMLGKNDFYQLISKSLGEKGVDNFKKNFQKMELGFKLTKTEEKVMIWNNLSEKSEKFNKEVFCDGFIKLVSGESHRFKSENVCLFKSRLYEYPCLVCSNRTPDKTCITFPNFDSPFNICKDCYSDFLTTKLNLEEEEITPKLI